jgi:olfactory receptor
MLVFASWLISFLIIFPALMLLLQLDYCRSNIIDHFACDYFPLLQISCSDTKFLEIMGFSCAVFTLMFTLALIFLSYIYIIRTILKIPSTSQRTKAFSTCSSHMVVISISYGSCIFMYIKPIARERVSLSKGVAVLNTSVAPMLNPFIYSLRNQQVKRAFMNMARKTIFFTSTWNNVVSWIRSTLKGNFLKVTFQWPASINKAIPLSFSFLSLLTV